MRHRFLIGLILVAMGGCAQEPGLVDYAWSGAVTDSSFALVFMPKTTGSFRISVSHDRGIAFREVIAVDGIQPVRVDIPGLEEATNHVWQVNGVTGRVSTFATGAFSFDVAVGSCADTGSESPLFKQIASRNPTLYLQTGDLHYGDIETDCEAAFRDHIGRVARSETQAGLYRTAPWAYMWDDHDYGPNNSAGDAPCRAVALDHYRRFFPHHPTAFTDSLGPVSNVFDAGRVRFILSDLRSQKVRPTYDPADPCKRLTAGTVFGSEAHLDWFFGELTEAKAKGQVVAWVSGIPWINAPGGPNYECGEDDDWGGYPEERTRIATFIRENGIPLFMVSGDAHMVAFDDGTNAEGGFPVFHAAPLDRRGSYKGGPYSHGFSTERGQFGWISVTDTGADSLTVTFSAYNLRDEPVVNTEGRPIQSSIVFRMN
jgi:alkaline phosphatase D